MNIFILDDMRNIKSALGAVGMRDLINDENTICLCRPAKTCFNSDSSESHIACSLEPALDIVNQNRRFDIWILDSDLGIGDGGQAICGYDFLKKTFELYPDKLPKCLYCCSSNLEQKNKILELFKSLSCA